MSNSVPTVALDFRPVRPPVSGVARYCLGIARSLGESDAFDLTLVGQFANSAVARDLAPKHSRQVNSQFLGGSRMRTLVSNAAIELGPEMLRRRITKQTDLVHETYFARLSHRSGPPMVATVHDTIPIDHPEWFNSRNREISRRNLQRQAEESAHIIAVSEFTKMRVIDITGAPSEKITVIPNGVDLPDRSVTQSNSSALPDAIDINRPVVLHVGNIEPRKNLLRLFHAVDEVRGSHPDVQLVLAGHLNFEAEESVELGRQILGDSLLHLGHVPDETRDELFRVASAVIFPSLYEGFGIPVLEAFAWKRPVVFAGNTSMGELAVSEQQVFDPLDVGAMASAMVWAMSGTSEVDDAVDAGWASLARFSWDAVARQTYEVYQEVLSA